MAVLKYKENGVWKNLSFVATQGDTVDLGGYVQKSELLDLIYPVGSIYISVNSTSPATLFGGTWVQIEDTFLLASGSNYAAGSTGGSATHYHGTTAVALTIDQMPSHSHQGRIGYNQSGYGYETKSWEAYLSSIASPIASTSGSNGELKNINTRNLAPTTTTGSGATHSHGNTTSASSLPPYLAVYMWKRTV